MKIHLFRNGMVEVGTGKPGYRWVNAYSSIDEMGLTSIPLTRESWRAMAKRDGDKLVFHDSRQLARVAAHSDAEGPA